MEKALDEQADAEKRSLEMTIEMDANIKLAELEQLKLTSLESATDEEQRAGLITRFLLPEYKCEPRVPRTLILKPP